MNYIYDYSIYSVVFLLIIISRFFSKRQFPNRKNRLFSIILICALLDILFDITSSLAIENALKIASPLLYINNTIFYTMQILFPVLLFLYVGAVSNVKTNRKDAICFLMPIFLWIMLLINFITPTIFHIDPISGYVHDKYFILIYINGILYVFATLIRLVQCKNNIKPLEYQTIFMFFFVVLSAIVLQYIFPNYLLIGAGITCAITMMYLIIQKPEDMLDTLTNAFNRQAMFNFLSDRLAFDESFHMIALEVHNLRRVNRIFGMSFGNSVLKEAANIMEKSAKDVWTFRIMGNIFVTVTTDDINYIQAKEYIESAFSNPCEIEGTEMGVMATVCCFGDTSSIQTADEAGELIETFISESKRGEYVNISFEMIKDVSQKSILESTIIRAIENDNVVIKFQPIFSTKTKKYEIAEALVRIYDEEYGEIGPQQFIPVAEKQGLISTIDEIVIKKTCEFIRDNSPRETLGIKNIELNLSAAEFVNEKLSKKIISITKEYNIEPDYLLFEITETTAAMEFEALNSNIFSLREEGFQFVLDDYGKGYSNISTLMRLPFVTIKFDKSMLEASYTNEKNRLLLLRTASIFSEMGIKTVVEGVETKEQASFSLCEIKADYIQGYYYSYPLSVEEYIEFVKKKNF